MTNRYDQAVNFVAAMPDTVTIEPPRADLIRRADVIQTVDRMIDGYMTQQRGLLDQVQGDATGGGFLSNAQQVDARRRLSRMYLLHQTAVTGMVAAGVVGIAYIAGVVDTGGAFVGWLALTGITALVLSTAMHRQEMQHSPEGIARHLLDWHGDIASYEAETRRLSLQWEHDAEARRQAAQERAAEHGRALAQLRVDELDARRRTIEAQRAQMYAESPSTAIAGRGDAVTGSQVQSIDDAPNDDSSGAVGDGWQGALVQWIVTLYEPGNVTDTGLIRAMVPWSARSPWLESDKAKAKEVMCEYKPALIVHDGNRWRLRLDLVSDADQALQVIAQRM
jgi:hypothetical protein